MTLTYDMIEVVKTEYAEILIPAEQLPYFAVHKLAIANPAHDLVTAIVDICWVTDVNDTSRRYPSIVGSRFAVEADNGKWMELPLTLLDVQALETDIQEAANA